jgi:cytochrome c oxidase cbb3-type subunit 3
MRQLLVTIAISACVLSAADTGELMFRRHCAPCHGVNGEGGRGPALAVRQLPRAPDDTVLAAIIHDGIPGTGMPGTRMTAEQYVGLVAWVRGLGRRPAPAVAGDRANGERTFRSKGCEQCHTVGGRGGGIGPDLTSIGARRSPQHLRSAILNPESVVPDNFAVYRRLIYMPDNFLQVRVVTQDGAQITGARADEDAFTIQLRDYTGRLYSFRKAELRELHKDWGKTPMPSYRGQLSEVEIQDLVAYLASLGFEK